jgi:predicted component of type VI protein secretion system
LIHWRGEGCAVLELGFSSENCLVGLIFSGSNPSGLGKNSSAFMPEAPKKFRIGRDAGCDLVIADRSVSRRHADLMVEPGGGLEILDRESSGGTFLLRDGKEHSISRARLRPTDALKFGEHKMTVKELLARLPKAPAPYSPAAKPPPVPGKSPSSPPAVSGAASTPAPASAGRMVRCECGTIKKRGARCPSCGS